MKFENRPGKQQPKIFRIGNNPDCIHEEHIENYIGTCRKCGRIKKYPDFIELSEQVFTAARYDRDYKKLNSYGMYLVW